MPGTLSATVGAFAPQGVSAGFGAQGSLDTGGFVPIVPMAVGFGQGGVVPAHFSRFDFPEGSGATTLSADGLHTVSISDAVKGWNNGPGFLTFSANGTVGDTAVRALATWTFSVVVNVASGPSGDFTVFSHPGAFFINILTDGRLRLYTTGLGTITSAAAPFTFGVPHRITVTSDGTTVREYVDGVQVLSAAGALPVDLLSASKFLEDWSGGATPTAAMDSLSFWNVTLTPAQVATLTAPTGTAEGTFAPIAAIRATAGMVLYGAGVLAVDDYSQIYNTQNTPKKAKLSAEGTLDATVTNNFVAFNTTATTGNTVRKATKTGVYVTLRGGGGDGGAGYTAGLGTAKSGGGGGGGGARVNRTLIPNSQLGTTWSCVKGGPGQASSFTSGGKTVTAGYGGDGATGSASSAGGAGGTESDNFTVTFNTSNGGAGGQGDNSSTGNAGNNYGGGGGGGAGNQFGVGTNVGGPGVTGGGAGGLGNVSTAGVAGSPGTDQGGGGGGGGGGNPGGAGGAGQPGDLLLEWV